MSCFHESYTRWKLAHGIIDQDTANRMLNFSNANRTSAPKQEMNRRSATNETHHAQRSKSLNWLNETLSDLTDLLLPNVTDWKMGNLSNLEPERKNDDIQRLANDEELSMIFKLYEMALAISTEEINNGDKRDTMDKIMLEQVIVNQELKFKDELSLIIDNEY